MKKWIAFLLILCLAGCAQNKPKSPFSATGFLSSKALENRKQSEVEKGTLRDLVQPDTETVSETDYKLMPGDKIQIDVSKRPELSNGYVVAERGFIVFPLLGEFPAQGLTINELKTKLETALLKYVRQPMVQAFVSEFVGQQVIVFGAVGDFGAEKQMGLVTLKKPTRILNFLASIGGPRPDADLSNITLIHKNGTKDVVNFNRILKQGDTRVNLYVQGGDTVLVPSAKDGKNKVLVLGAIKIPGIYAFNNDLTALEATTLAGSFVRASTPEKTFVIRTNVENPYLMYVDLKRVLLKGESQRDITLKNGDIVFVPPNSISKYNQYIADIRPTLDVFQIVSSIFLNSDALAVIFDRGFGNSNPNPVVTAAQTSSAVQSAVVSGTKAVATTAQ